jgi:hypothetical protein
MNALEMVLEIARGLGTLYNSIYEFLFMNISIGGLTILGWQVTAGLTFTPFGLILGGGLVVFIVWGLRS